MIGKPLLLFVWLVSFCSVIFGTLSDFRDVTSHTGKSVYGHTLVTSGVSSAMEDKMRIASCRDMG